MVPNGTAAYEKRGIAADVPHWEMANCIQCNMCSYVCPHGVIRPFVLDEKEAEPIKDSVLPMRGEDGKYFALSLIHIYSANTIEIMNIIKAISRDRLVVLVTHEVELAKFYASRIIELKDGKIINDYANQTDDNLDYRIDNLSLIHI